MTDSAVCDFNWVAKQVDDRNIQFKFQFTKPNGVSVFGEKDYLIGVIWKALDRTEVRKGKDGKGRELQANTTEIQHFRMFIPR